MIAKCSPRTFSSMLRVVGYCVKPEKGYIIDSTLGYAKNEIQDSLANSLPEKIGVREGNAIAHCVLRLAPGENLDDETFSRLSNDYKEKMNFKDRDYVTVLHNDVKEGQHVHMIVSYYDKDGKRWDDSFFKRRSEEARKELEIKYGLQLVGHGGEAKNVKKGKVDYKDFASELNRNTLSARSYAQQQIKGVLWGKKDLSLTDFVKELNKRNIEVNFNLQKDNTKIAGVTFTVRSDYNDYTFKGSQVAKVYSFSNLEKKLSIGNSDIAFAAALNRFQHQDTAATTVITKNTNLLKDDILSFAASNDVVIGRKAMQIFENSRLNNSDISKVDLYLDNCKNNPSKVVKLVDYINSEHISRSEKSIDRFLLNVENKTGSQNTKKERNSIINLFDANYFSPRCFAALKSSESFIKSDFTHDYDIKLSERIQSTLERGKGGYSRNFNERIAELYPEQNSKRIKNMILTDSEKHIFSNQLKDGGGDLKFLEKVLLKNEVYVLEKLYTKFELSSIKGDFEFSKENFLKIEQLARDSNFNPKILTLPMTDKFVNLPSLSLDASQALSPLRSDNLGSFDNSKSLADIIEDFSRVPGTGSLSIEDGENQEVRKRKNLRQ